MKNVWVISSPEAKFNENALYYFKKTINIKNVLSSKINITADARYKLWINGDMVSFGPYKGTQHFHYYNTVDIAKYLKDGENEILVEVLQLSAYNDISKHKFLSSVQRTGNLAFLMWGEIECSDGVYSIGTDDSWECAKDNSVKFLIPAYAYYTGIGQYAGVSDGLKWTKASNLIEKDSVIFYGETKLWNLRPHECPPQRYEMKEFSNKDSAGNYDYGKITTGFVRVHLKGHGKIKLTYAECYVFEEDGQEIKRDRSDTNGVINGDYDVIEVDGEKWFETFWFRTFRYIKAEGDVEIEKIIVAETGYPLNVDNNYDFGNNDDNKLWEICVNTLKCCMHETYEDCPYYEQLQYAMDTYLQMLFTMKLTDDCRLVKNGINDFASSLTVGDISQSRFPSAVPQYITGFSLFFIYMLDGLERGRGEHKFIKKYLGTVENILSTFETYKRQDGLIGKNQYWNFIDWAEGWEEGHGVPKSEPGDALTVYNLMYACALMVAARLNKIYGRDCIAKEYLDEAQRIKALVKETCYDDNMGLYADTDRKETFSQHAQIWAVLCELDDLETGRQLMEKSFSLKAQGGFAYAYFVYRALQKVGMYEHTEKIMDGYRELMKLNCTTIPEIPTNPRSECHGWGAAMIYEFTTVVLGVNDSEDGILIEPYTAGRNYAKGKVCTKHGFVFVDWKIEEGEFKINVSAEDDTALKIVLPDKTTHTCVKTFNGKCKI